MKKILTVFTVITALFVGGLGGCTNQDVGVLTGGLLGGLLGSQFGKGSGQAAAIVGGALIGGFIGGQIGRNMDKVDRMKMSHAIESNKDEQVSEWKNPNTGTQYYVKPTKTYYNQSDQPCREYTTKAIIGGKTQTIYGKACRMAEGLFTCFKPLSVIAKTPSSFTAPKRFLIARIIRKR